MSLKYEDSKIIKKRLEVAHNPRIAKIRGEFFQREYSFFKRYIKNQRVLIAGAGLGHDSFELAKYNKEVIGIELLKDLVKESKKIANKRGVKEDKIYTRRFHKTEI